MFKRAFSILSSLRLTVVCLVMAMVLVFAGTLAQVHLGLWDAQKIYFQSAFVYWNPGGGSLKIPVWPGGYLLGWVLLSLCVSAAQAEGDANRGKVLAYTCHGCHGIESYNNVYPTYSVPKLQGQHPEYLAAALQAYSSNQQFNRETEGSGEYLGGVDIFV